MPSTRRTSRKHQGSVKNEKPRNDESLYTTVTSGDNTMDSMSESQSSDWQPESKRSKKNTHHSGKRARVSVNPGSSKSTQKDRRARKSLSLLVTMPLDILFEILSLLSPKDLINLTRTNKPLRETLIARNATTVWKSARKNVGCPDCPPDFSELRWATLSFGTKCQLCGTSGVLNVDFDVRRRACVSCRKSNLVVRSKFPLVFPDYDPVILDFIPYTNVGGWAYGHSSTSKFYWESDIDDMARRWGSLQKDLHMRLIGARQRIDEFRATRIKLVEAIIKHADTCKQWAHSTTSQKRAEGEEIRKKRYDAIVSRFNALGYTDSEVESISWQKECLRGGELTERVWRRIQPILEPRIQDHRKARIRAAHEAIVAQRTAILEENYKLYLRTVRPSQWVHHPRLKDLTEFSVFEPLINASDDVAIGDANFQEPMSTLGDLASTWLEQRMANLRDKIILTPHMHESLNDEGTISEPIDPIYLATSIFKCGNSMCGVNNSPWGELFSNPLFAWEGAVTHNCRTSIYYSAKDLPTELAFSEKGSMAATQLVSLAGLDPISSTPSDMDQADLRFFCSHCAPRQFGDNSCSRGLPAYTWRAAVAHFMSHSHSTDPFWQLLTSEQATVVKLAEAPDPIQNNFCWTCNHCAIYLDSWQPRQNIVEHLAAVHDIRDCHEPRDLFNFPNLRRSVVTVPVFKLSLSNP